MIRLPSQSGVTKFRVLIIALAACVFCILSMQPAFALDMASRRDCVVCHIMWMEDFRTDQETLVEWQPSNVLMKDTQGVVSSEEICYSCHDGYVLDSRDIVWKYNRHKTFVKPSKNVTIPPNLPLSIKDEIYCGTCHSAHGKGSAPHGDPMGRTGVYREVNIDSSLCEQCHRNEGSPKHSNGHPLHVTSLELPDKLFAAGAERATSKNEVICQSCHKVHGAKGEKILLVSNKNSELCVICHEKQGSIIDTKHDLRTTFPEAKNIKKQQVSESGPCSACHTPHNAAGKKLWALELDKGNPATQMCMTCHGEQITLKIKHTGKYSHPINVELPSKEPPPANLPLFSEEGVKTPDGKVQCFTCHNVHRWDPEHAENKGGKEVEGDSSNSFLRAANTSSNLCLECHTDKKQIITSDHNLSVTAPDEKNVQGFTSASSGPCGVCHIPHNAVSNPLWARNIAADTGFITQECTGCHNKKGAAKTKLIGDNYHPVDVALKKFGITTALPLYDSSGKRTADGKLVCATCHDPHVWDPNNPVTDYEFKNMEGTASNSFLRRANFPSSDLCKACHANQSLIDATDHDLNVTAPEAKNLLGQTAKESGTCGVCHLVHNGPNKLKLWARPYGDVLHNEDSINGLCNSCHLKGRIAENKIPLIATHPEDKLINNILRSNKLSVDYAPIYDKKTGREVNVGNISCPTCHNAHQWSPLVKQKGSGRNQEGNATSSFLRNAGYNNICIDCHGLDALFRYKYFHDPHERVESPKQIMRITQ